MVCDDEGLHEAPERLGTEVGWQVEPDADFSSRFKTYHQTREVGSHGTAVDVRLLFQPA